MASFSQPTSTLPLVSQGLHGLEDGYIAAEPFLVPEEPLVRPTRPPPRHLATHAALPAANDASRARPPSSQEVLKLIDRIVNECLDEFERLGGETPGSATGVAVNLQYQNITQVPRQAIDHLLPNFLAWLDVSGNKLHHLPQTFSELTWLRNLNLASNHFDEFPLEICALTELQVLNLSSNRIEKMPCRSYELKNLHTLDLSSNQFSAFPMPIGGIPSLRALDLSFNHIGTVPARIPGLRSLQYLSLLHNDAVPHPEPDRPLDASTEQEAAPGPQGAPGIHRRVPATGRPTPDSPVHVLLSSGGAARASAAVTAAQPDLRERARLHLSLWLRQVPRMPPQQQATSRDSADDKEDWELMGRDAGE